MGNYINSQPIANIQRIMEDQYLMLEEIEIEIQVSEQQLQRLLQQENGKHDTMTKIDKLTKEAPQIFKSVAQCEQTTDSGKTNT